MRDKVDSCKSKNQTKPENPSFDLITTTVTPQPSSELIIASEYLDKQICSSDSYTFIAPDKMIFFAEKSFYSVSLTSKCNQIK